jgi:hypothetical protein
VSDCCGKSTSSVDRFLISLTTTMGFGAAHHGIMVRVGHWYGSDDEEDEEDSYNGSDSDVDSNFSDFYDSDNDEQPSNTLTDLSAVSTLPLDIIFEVRTPSLARYYQGETNPLL